MGYKSCLVDKNNYRIQWPVKINGVEYTCWDFMLSNTVDIVAADFNERGMPECDPNGTIIDIGAHVGVWTIYMAKKYPQAKIYAVEPVPYNYANLVQNLADNGITNVAVVRGAITGDGRNVTINTELSNGGSSSIYNNNYAKSHIDVESMTLTALIESIGSETIDLVKMDVEGAEYEILPAAPLGRIKRLVLDLHGKPGLEEPDTELAKVDLSSFLVSKMRSRVTIYE